MALTDAHAVQLIDEVVQGNKRLLLGVVRPLGGTEPPEGAVMHARADELYEVGTLGTVVRMLKLGDGTVRVMVQGLERARLVEIASTEHWLVAGYEPLPNIVLEDARTEALKRNVHAQFSRVIDIAPYLGEELHEVLVGISDPGRLADFVAANLDLALPAKADLLDLKAAREILDRDHYDLKTVKERILEYLAVRTLNPSARGGILCFVGPPGVGKTSLGQSIAEALGRRFTRVSLGGVRDEAEVRGHRRTYVGALPGRIIHALQRCETRNPLLMLDEIDKMGADVRGDPTAALLEVLDPAQNGTFVDHYLEVPFDLSGVMFIATANSLAPIPDPLLDRMEVLTLPGYTPGEKLAIAKRYLLPRQLKETGLQMERASVADGALERLIGEYTREAGVRQLEREIQGVLRKAALEVVEGRAATIKITAKNLEKFAGQPKVQSEVAGREAEVGVATGLAWTPVGGDIMFIEAIQMPGKGQITLTGQLGDVMKESAQAAWSLLRARAGALGIPLDAFTQTDVHLHVPAGAVPKDGPSAGITIAAALASLLCRRPARHDVAMTGELTLRGRVLPIGGLKEKLTAAVRAGVKTVLVPARNKSDVVEVPDEVKRLLDIRPVETIDEVLELALLEPRVSRPVDVRPRPPGNLEARP